MKLGTSIAAKFDSYPNMIQKVDFGRYVVLYSHGGITVDTDMVQLRPIDTTPFIDTAELMVSVAGFPMNVIGHVNNAIFLARRHHPIVFELINSLVRDTTQSDDFISRDIYVACTTGPIMVHKFLRKFGESVTYLDHKYYEPCHSADRLCRPGMDAIMDHRHDASWQSPISRVIGMLVTLLSYILIVLSVLAAGYAVVRGMEWWEGRPSHSITVPISASSSC